MDTPSPAGAAWVAALKRQLEVEVAVMLRHALSAGRALPASLAQAVEEQRAAADAEASGQSLALLAQLHADLAQLVAPARPGTLRLLQAGLQKTGLSAMMGPLSNLRRLTAAALICVLCFVGLSMSPEVNDTTLAGSIYRLDGITQLVVMAFLLAAAGMGSTFQALFKAQAYVSEATYDPVYDASYWIRIGLGLVAGLMLAVLVPLDAKNGESIARPVLALLGGFSVQLVHLVLQRLVDAVRFMFDGQRNPPDKSVAAPVPVLAPAPAPLAPAPAPAPASAPALAPSPFKDAPDLPGSQTG